MKNYYGNLINREVWFMKVLHITRTIGQGGAEKIVLQLCKDVVGFDHFVASCGGIHEINLYKFCLLYTSPSPRD